MPSSRQTESAQKSFSRGTRGRERGGEDEIEERERRKHKNLRATRHFRKVARTEGCRVWG